MTQAWKNLDLEGGGVQTVNLHYVRLHKKTALAYLFCFGFFLGAHRFYLKSPGIGLIYLISSLVIAAGWWFLDWSIYLLVLELPALGLDLFRIPERVTRINKELRLSLYQQANAAPPAGFAGRIMEQDDLLGEYTALKEDERAGVDGFDSPAPGKRIPSFAEQEAMLQTLQSKRRDKGNN